MTFSLSCRMLIFDTINAKQPLIRRLLTRDLKTKLLSNIPVRCKRTRIETQKPRIEMASSENITCIKKDQTFDFFLVLDFEATCDDKIKPIPQEIIEFPVLKVNGKTFAVESEFHQYVEPTVNKELSSFCTQLTGIVQDMVDGQPDIKETLQKFEKWMEDEGLLDEGVKSVFVTCGDWDLKTMLPSEAEYFEIEYPTCLKTWINIKKPFSAVMTNYPKGMMEMLSALNLQHTGRHHSGIDDCRNISKILKALAEKGYVFKATGHIK